MWAVNYFIHPKDYFMDNKTQLLPSLLYVEGDEKVNQEVEDDLKISEPSVEVAVAALTEHTSSIIVDISHVSS
jgi:hypothetical protein